MPYVKTSVRTTRSGTVRYLQLAHNEWDQATQRSRTKVLSNFGREDEVDKDAVRRLVSALSRLLDPAEALAAAEPGELPVTGSRPAGGTHVLDQMWRRLRLDEVIRRRLAGRATAGRKPDPDTGRVLFALVANRALAASSKLAAAGWACEDVHIDGLDQVTDDACYRAMDQLLAIEPDLAEQAYRKVTDLLNLEVDLLFFDYPAPGYTVNRSGSGSCISVVRQGRFAAGRSRLGGWPPPCVAGGLPRGLLLVRMSAYRTGSCPAASSITR